MESCGEVFRREQIRSHLIYQCINAKVECAGCETMIKINDENHSCT